MNKRNRFITSLLLTISLILSTTMPIMAEEIVEDTAEIQSVNEEATLDSIDDTEASIQWVRTDPLEGFVIMNVSDVSEDHVLTQNAPSPYEDVILTTFTNGYTEQVQTGAISSKADKIYFYNNGTVTASHNDPYQHWITIGGYDGHGETFYVNRNFFDISDEELNNLTLGEFIDNRYYEPVSGLAIFTYDCSTEDIEKTITPTLSIVHNDYYLPNQTWIKISYDKPLTKEEQIKAYKESFPNRIYYNDNDFIEVVSGNIFSGKKLKPIISIGKTIINTVDGDDSKISEIYDTIYYSSDNKKQLKVKYRNNKNSGTATAVIRKCKERPELKGKEIQFTIEPVTVSDNNMKLVVRSGVVKSVKVLTNGKYKKVKKNMWKLVGSQIEFSGNYKGSVSLNNL